MPTNRATNTAIEAYRNLLRTEERRRLADEELVGALRDPDVNLTAYMEATLTIDQHVDIVDQEADAAGWKSSTRKQRVYAAIGSAGRA